MHKVSIRPHIVERVMARRGKLHWFDTLDAQRTALVVIDMQSTFCASGAPAEVPAARGIVPAINALSGALRSRGVPVYWVLHANSQVEDRSDWELFFDHVVSGETRAQTLASLAPGNQSVWPDLDTTSADVTVFKNRYSALIAGASNLEDLLRKAGIDTLLIAGTKTNVCCESTARDAMMLGFKVVMLSDCCAALSDDEHQATLETFIQQFGDVMTSAGVLKRLGQAAQAA